MEPARFLIAVATAAALLAGCAGPPASVSATVTASAAASPTSATTPDQGLASAAPTATGAPSATTAPPAAPASATFGTPEDAIQAYLAGVAKADPQAILAACAIEEMSTGFHFDLYVDRLKAMILTTSLAPATSPMYIAMNRAQLTTRAYSSVRNLTWSLLSTEKIDGSTIVPADKARADAFTAAVDPGRLAAIRVVDVRLSMPSLQKSATNLSNWAAQSAVYGADEMSEWVALISFESKQYVVGFTMIRYGASWKVEQQVANLAGTNSLGSAEPITTDGFDQITK